MVLNWNPRKHAKDIGVRDKAIVIVLAVEEGDMDAGKGKKLG
jgi:hypothetical protein